MTKIRAGSSPQVSTIWSIIARIDAAKKDANGKELDKITNKVGVIEVTQVLAQSSICKIIEGKPAQGDTLQPN